MASIKELVEAAKKEAELQAEDVIVVVIDKGELLKDIHNGRYNDYCTMKFQIIQIRIFRELKEGCLYGICLERI